MKLTMVFLIKKNGIQNLKRILPKLLEWSYEEGKNYDDLKELYLNVNSQFRRYIGHVSTNVGGVFEDLKSNEEKGSVYVQALYNCAI